MSKTGEPESELHYEERKGDFIGNSELLSARMESAFSTQEVKRGHMTGGWQELSLAELRDLEIQGLT